MQSHKHKHRRHPVASLWQGWGPYFRQGIWPAALALALLYLTVLSLGLMMTAYLKWVGMTEAELSLYRGAGAVSGLLATAVFPFLHRPAGKFHGATTGICHASVIHQDTWLWQSHAHARMSAQHHQTGIACQVSVHSHCY